jgi:hypothetical protein
MVDKRVKARSAGLSVSTDDGHTINSVHELDWRVIDRHRPTVCRQNQTVVRH